MTERREVAVIGGGLAGITAALRCADGGRKVTLYESRPRLGGLTASFRRGDLHVDTGQHVFLRCCTAYRRLLERLGVADLVILQDRLEIPVRSPGDAAGVLGSVKGPLRLRSRGRGQGARLWRSALPAPLHLGPALLRYRLLSLGERIRFARAALALRRVDPADPRSDAETFGAWLAAHGQSPAAVSALWDLVGVATLNAHADQASLGLAATVFQVGLLTDAAAADIGWSRVPLQRLHGDAALAQLARAGARVRTSVKVDAIRRGGDGWVVVSRGGEDMVDQVVLATPPTVAERLLPPGSLPLTPGWSQRLGASPIVNVHVIYDRRVLDVPFVAGAGTPVQWVFDRTGASGLVDGQYVAVSLSAADDVVDRPVSAIRDLILPELARLLPAAAHAQILDFFVTREREATFRPAPGSAALRPGPVTAHPGLALAGAWTATGWPATMEGAARSGEAAADALLDTEAGSPSPVTQTTGSAAS